MPNIKKYFLILTLFLILIEGCQQPELGQNKTNEPLLPQIRGADYFYCTGLGYKYEMRIEGDTHEEFCMFPTGEECVAFDFLTGECHRKFTLCELKGYDLRMGIEQHEGYNKTYAICIFHDRSYCKEYDFFNRKCHVNW